MRTALLAFSVAAVVRAQAPTVTFVSNAASGASFLAPGVLSGILGGNLAVGSCTSSSVPAPTMLCEARVTVGGRPAAMLFASPTTLNVQLPVDLPAGEFDLFVERQNTRSAAVRVQLNRHAPGLYTTNERFGTIFKPLGTLVTPQDPANPGDRLTLLAVGLGPTNPAIATGALPPSGSAPTTTQPRVLVSDRVAEVFSSSLSPTLIGIYLVGFVVPDGLPAGNHPVRLEIGDASSNAVPMPVAPARVPSISGVVNGASFAPEAVAAPGTILSVFGSNFGSRDNLNAYPQIEFDGLSVRFDDARASLFAVVASRNQINVLAPNDLPESGTVSVRVVGLTSSSAGFLLRLVPASPGIFRIADPANAARRNAAALFVNTVWLAVPGSMARALQIPENCSGRVSPAASCGQPAAPGDVLQIFVTGLGRATPNGDPAGRTLPLGAVAPADGNPLYRTLATPAVTIGAVPAEVLYSGLAPGFAGLYQINIRVPQAAPAGDDVEIRVTMAGASDIATIAIRR